MRSSNPVLTRLTPETPTGYQQQVGYGQPGYGQDVAYPGQVITPGQTDRMTIDDVVVRTIALLGTTGLSAALAWVLVPEALTGIGWMATMLTGLVLGLVITFKQITSPGLIFAYAVIMGTFLGLVSRTYEAVFDGIVLQAVTATFGVFFLMALLYKFKVLRATPKFVRIVTGLVLGVVAASLLTFVLSFFGITTGLRGNADGSANWIAIGFSLLCIVAASLTFVLDFDQAEQGVKMGLEKKYAWLPAFGMLVGLIWLYLEILRLLSYLRGDD